MNEKLLERLQSIAILAVSAQSETDVSTIADTLSDIEADLKVAIELNNADLEDEMETINGQS